ncbi:hypothetical protein C8R45DRAFT_1115872 [Mycena sanguinolenta]|nr:hypothetical protein C8R45DRAFT_1115872 [Mycena sanguinolenta]
MLLYSLGISLDSGTFSPLPSHSTSAVWRAHASQCLFLLPFSSQCTRVVLRPQHQSRQLPATPGQRPHDNAAGLHTSSWCLHMESNAPAAEGGDGRHRVVLASTCMGDPSRDAGDDGGLAMPHLEAAVAGVRGGERWLRLRMWMGTRWQEWGKSLSTIS